MSRFCVLLLAVSVASATVAPDRVPCAGASQTTSHRCCHEHGPSLTPPATSSCCVAGAPRDAGTPALPRIDIAPQPAPLPTVAAIANPYERDVRAARIPTSPPRAHPIDLPTLFATLLI